MKSEMLSIMAAMMLGSITSFGQDIEADVPGDHFSLEGALELFKKSESPEHFEKLLNSPDAKINNLDLNGDGYIDYVRVFDRYEGKVHVFILQAVVSESENQDVAVIELEKKSNGEAVLQIVGDEDIYGVTTIIEPTREVRTYAGTTTTNTVVNVWDWPVVQYVYDPRYVVWHSPWGWHHHPVWWHTWRPVVYVHYYSYWRPYRPHYAVCHTRRVVYAHHIYHPHRTSSVIVHRRHHAQVTRYRTAHRDDRNGRDRYDNGRSRSSRTAYDYDRSSNDNRSRRSTYEQSLRDTNGNRYKRTSPGMSKTRDTQKNRYEAVRSSENRLSYQKQSSKQSPEIRQRHDADSYRPLRQNNSGLEYKNRKPAQIKNNRDLQRPSIRSSTENNRQRNSLQRTSAPTLKSASPGNTRIGRSQESPSSGRTRSSSERRRIN